MKIATFTDAKSTRIGVVTGETILDLSQAAPQLPTEMRAFLEAGAAAMDAARTAASQQRGDIPLANVRLEAPVPRPHKFLALAMNYYLRVPFKTMDAAEVKAIEVRQRAEKQENRQSWYNKQVTCITQPYGTIQHPHEVKELYFEPELAFVVGATCRNVRVADAAKYIAGFFVSDDVTEGGWCRGSMTLSMGKSFDTFGPQGPWIVTPDEVGDPHQLEIRGYVNGELRQGGNTRDMIFNCYELIAFASRRCTLEAGDVVTTGMPFCHMDPIHPGDIVRCEIDRVGHIENRVIPEPR